MPSEKTFTPPCNFCPNPEHWNAYDGNATEDEVIDLICGFIRAIQPELIVETGTYLGTTSEIMANALVLNGHGRLITFETNEARCKIAKKRLEGQPAEVINGSILSWTSNSEIGFAWFDSNQNQRVDEFFHVKKWLSKGAVVGFHDTGPQHSVKNHIHKIVNSLNIISLRTPRGCCFAQVK